MAGVAPSGTHRVRFRDASGQEQKPLLSVKVAAIVVRLPVRKQKHYAHQRLQIIHAEEINPPDNRPALFWKLITNLTVETHEDAVRKPGWYARRWSIETFFKTLSVGAVLRKSSSRRPTASPTALRSAASSPSPNVSHRRRLRVFGRSAMCGRFPGTRDRRRTWRLLLDGDVPCVVEGLAEVSRLRRGAG